ncbi:hypothetical protein NDQ72_10935 [Halomonas sp. KG2]|uniref:phage tail terminator protein n=1 Tax=Halomonas sp. KG2 TaxID=2951138 RepID=UPI0026490B09|nr:hypothetical protein [Halomonas sp. KG2]WKD26589.1 hypothetical protein NDQ72_10935 [Halomonas sp. KG2]
MNQYDIIDPLIERIQELCPELSSVEEAWFHTPLDDYNGQLPMACPYLVAEAATGDAETLRPRQRVKLRYGVWLVARKDDFRQQKQELYDALFGYQAGPRHDPLQFHSGKVEDIKGSIVWWISYWETDTHMISTPA